MKAIAVLASAVLLFTGCAESNIEPTCATPATVRDLAGLDGCGWVFELEDGTRLEPFWPWWCGTPPLPKEVTDSPLYQYEYVDGKTVYITYELMTDMASTCMAGQVAQITCISDRVVDTGE